MFGETYGTLSSRSGPIVTAEEVRKVGTTPARRNTFRMCIAESCDLRGGRSVTWRVQGCRAGCEEEEERAGEVEPARREPGGRPAPPEQWRSWAPAAWGQRPLNLSTSVLQAKPGLSPTICPLGVQVFHVSIVHGFLKVSFHFPPGRPFHHSALPAKASGVDFPFAYSTSPFPLLLGSNSSPPLLRGQGGYEQSPLPLFPKTPEKNLGQLWFQSYNAWFKREERKKREKAGYRSEKI